MRVLFAVFVLCLAALILTLVALRWHVRKHDVPSGEPLPLTGMHEDSVNQND